ncbi:hypothetical protein MMC26_006684 [Xylographa opegraphella]|nr:hypothetical protein [Xylographa opegraphella]
MDGLVGAGLTNATTAGRSVDLLDMGDEDITTCDEPVLPSPVLITHRPRFPSLDRKRTRDDIPSCSSDPPIFSSDDLPPGLENYDSHRRKRQYRGTWWENRVGYIQSGGSAPVRRKREFKRNIDSAVWMGSDETETTDDGELDIEADLEKRLLPMESSESRFPNGCRSRTALHNPVSPSPRLQYEEIAQEEAARVVQELVDDDSQVIDLSGRALGEIWNSTLKPLHYLTVQDHNYFPPSQEAYRSLIPRISLYISNNDLEDLPGEIYKLQNLVDLSPRQNKLTSILPSILNLTNLESLNLSANNLRYLPWEILVLAHRGKLTSMAFHPNPFITPVSTKPGLSLPEGYGRFFPNTSGQVASSSVAYLDITGRLCRGSSPNPAVTKNYVSSARGQYSSTPRPWADKPAPTPSLFELALRACSACPDFGQIIHLLPKDAAPHLWHTLKWAQDLQEAGGQLCSECLKSFVMPRAIWVEWWDGLGNGHLPFLKQGCSWACVSKPDDVPKEWINCGWAEAAD